MAKRRTRRVQRVRVKDRVLNARPDTMDFRDRMFVPTLTEVPPRWDLTEYCKCKVPILDQGTEGACTGFGLATVANYLLRTRRVDPEGEPVSPRMLYEMARRYDEWPGEDYAGSSARGAMKGWHKHGVCSEELWPYRAGADDEQLTPDRAEDARHRPLGAYFRVNHRDLVAMHCALAEVGVLYATAEVHAGWDEVGDDGRIPLRAELLGGHAFAVVAYDQEGFWIQNSWGTDWGRDGFGLVSYDDWLEHATDVWVARLGVPICLVRPEASAAASAAAATTAHGYTFHDLRPHIVSIGNDGQLRKSGTYGTTEESLRLLFAEDFPRITRRWKKKRLLLYAHGGLTDEQSAVQRVADYRQALLDAEVYPLSLIWKSDFWTTLFNILREALDRRRAEGLLDEAKDFMLDRLDDALEPIARGVGGKAQWDEMKENALLATKSRSGAMRSVLAHIARLAKGHPDCELHLVGHSAGAVLHAPVVQLLTSAGKIKGGPLNGEKGLGLRVASCTLWAPACTVELFNETYVPAAESGGIDRLCLFTLTDRAEQEDHCSQIYNKSLLYLVSNAFEKVPRIPLIRPIGVPIVGMERFIRSDNRLKKWFNGRKRQWVLSPNTASPGTPGHSTALHHGDFDDDRATLLATLAWVLGRPLPATEMDVHHSKAALHDRRKRIEEAVATGPALPAR